MSKKRENDIRRYFQNTQGEDLATGGDREKTEAKRAKTMASQDALPKVKRERLESQTMASQDALPKVKRERLESQDKGKHKSSHTFNFHEDGKLAVNTISCTEAGTVLEALNRSRKFTSLVSNNKGKDIVIVKNTPENADIATHFPCWLIKEAEKFTIKFCPGNQSDPEPPETATITEEGELVTFYVERKGGKNIKKKKFLKNTRNTGISYLCIYARVGETAEEALRRDGRFAKIVFQGGSELEDIKSGDLLEIHFTVTERHNGTKFRLNMQKDKKKPSQPTTKTNSGSRIAEQGAGPSQDQGDSTPSSATSAPANPPAQERGESTSRSAGSFHALPDSEELLRILRSQFEGLVKHMKARKNVRGNGKVLELLREEYGKNIKVFWDVNRVKNLMEMSKSVCVLINNTANLKGTGFLLFDRFILTNAHLIKNFSDSIHVNFHYEEEPMTEELLLPVKKVVASAYGCVYEKCRLDYALLELDESTAEKMPEPLLTLTQYSPPIQQGGLCIIGHPEGEVKRVDFCSVIESTQRESVLKKNTNLIQCMNWDRILVAKDSPVITYDTCFFYGASGSPVFNADGQVVAMHTGGYSYKLCGTKSMIEYAIPLQPILKHFLKVMEEERPDICKSFTEVAQTQEALCPLIAPDSPELMDTS